MSEQYDPFHLDSGVKENFDGTVVDGHFGKTDSAGDTLFLMLKILADDGEEVDRRFSCGEGWQTFDGGATAEHSTRKYFSNNSNLGILVTKAFATGGEDALRKRSAELDDRGPRDARLWVGFRAHWDVERETFKMKDNDAKSETFGQMVERERVLVIPTAFIDMIQPAAAQQAGSQAAQAPPTISGSGESSGDSAAVGEIPPAFATVNAGMQQMIRSLAKQHPYTDWIDKVMSLPGVIENDKLMAGISDEAFYTQLRDH